MNVTSDIKPVREEWIDVAKGIGIMLVIAGHTIAMKTIQPIYAFHLPLFFLLSGLVFNHQKYAKASVFFPEKTRQLLRPWLIMFLISLCVCLLIPEWRARLSLSQIMTDLYTTMTNNVQNSSLWFLLCLYALLCMFFFVNKIPRNVYTLTLMAVVALALPWFKQVETEVLKAVASVPENRLPMKIDSALLGLVFFCLGAWFPQIIRKTVQRVWSWPALILLSVAAFYVAWWDKSANMQFCVCGKYYILYYPVALLGVAAVCLISYRIARKAPDKVRELFAFYGRNSLLIFGFQSLFIRLYILLFNHLQGLEMRLYQNNPMEHQIGSFLVVTFLCCPLVVFFFQYLRKKGIHIL